MDALFAVLGAAMCIACMAMMGGMVLGGVRQLLRQRDEH